MSEKVLEIYSEMYKHIKTIQDEEIESEKFLKILDDVKNDDDLKDKITFLERRRQESIMERQKLEGEMENSKFNKINPFDVDYEKENDLIEKEFENVKLTDSLHESRILNSMSR